MINVLGLAGSGKSTQGQMLAKKLNCPWISMSQLLQEKGDDNIRAVMLQGKIVDDKLTLAILDEYLKSINADQKECVIDGWPRSLSQADWLVAQTKAGKVMVSGIIHLNAHSNIAKQRLLRRGRRDDSEVAIAQRFKDYQETILPIINHLAAAGIKVYEINADENIESVQEQINKALGVS